MYQHILVALDLSEQAQSVLERALALKTANDGHITLMHVIEPIAYAYGGDIPLDMTEVSDTLKAQAKETLTVLCDSHGLGSECVQVVLGRAATEVHDFANENGVDLIVVGSHGRSGLQLLLGSTANSILHGAHCDVLAVRIQED